MLVRTRGGKWRSRNVGGAVAVFRAAASEVFEAADASGASTGRHSACDCRSTGVRKTGPNSRHSARAPKPGTPRRQTHRTRLRPRLPVGLCRGLLSIAQILAGFCPRRYGCVTITLGSLLSLLWNACGACYGCYGLLVCLLWASDTCCLSLAASSGAQAGVKTGIVEFCFNYEEHTWSSIFSCFGVLVFVRSVC